MRRVLPTCGAGLGHPVSRKMSLFPIPHEYRGRRPWGQDWFQRIARTTKPRNSVRRGSTNYLNHFGPSEQDVLQVSCSVSFSVFSW